MPTEILIHIFSFLPCHQQYHLRLLNKTFRKHYSKKFDVVTLTVSLISPTDCQCDDNDSDDFYIRLYPHIPPKFHQLVYVTGSVKKAHDLYKNE